MNFSDFSSDDFFFHGVQLCSLRCRASLHYKRQNRSSQLLAPSPRQLCLLQNQFRPVGHVGSQRSGSSFCFVVFLPAFAVTTPLPALQTIMVVLCLRYRCALQRIQSHDHHLRLALSPTTVQAHKYNFCHRTTCVTTHPRYHGSHPGGLRLCTRLPRVFQSNDETDQTALSWFSRSGVRHDPSGSVLSCPTNTA